MTKEICFICESNCRLRLTFTGYGLGDDVRDELFCYVHDFIKDFIGLCTMPPVRARGHIFDDVYKLNFFFEESEFRFL